MADFDLNSLAPYAEGLFQSALLQDWSQTRQIARDPKRLAEVNPLIGEHPSQDKVNAYMTLAGIAQYGGYKLLPDDFKFPYALATAILEGKSVYGNKKNNNLDLNLGALGVGALLTGLMVHDYNKSHKNNLGISLQKIDNTLVPTVSMQW